MSRPISKAASLRAEPSAAPAISRASVGSGHVRAPDLGGRGEVHAEPDRVRVHDGDDREHLVVSDPRVDERRREPVVAGDHTGVGDGLADDERR